MSTDTPSRDECEIEITLTAQKKAFRMYRAWELKEKARSLSGELHRRKQTNEYHLRTWRHRKGRREGIVLVLKVKPGQIVVVTQMHEHINYDQDSDFRQVGGFERE